MIDGGINMLDYIHLKIKRQNGSRDFPKWEEFKVPYKPNMNVLSVLMEIRKNRLMQTAKKLHR